MKKKSNILSGLVTCVALCLLLMMIPAKTEAASAEKKAFNVYKKFLVQETVNWNKSGKKVKLAECQFAAVYIDNDSVPELVLHYVGSDSTGGSGSYALYTYKNKKVKYVCNLGSSFSYYKKKGVFATCCYWKGLITYCKYSNGKKTDWLEKANEKVMGIDWDGNGKTNVNYWIIPKDSKEEVISKSYFNKQLTKKVGSKKAMTPKYRMNTAKNRKKYLK